MRMRKREREERKRESDDAYLYRKFKKKHSTIVPVVELLKRKDYQADWP